jgi:hypothetical protein
VNVVPRKPNKFGLSGDIPKPVERAVRRRCGFGCVICGDAIFTYEHFDPPFKEAREHKPKGITLLCGSHQNESSKGLLSRQTIRSADAEPYCKQHGYATHVFDLGAVRPRLFIGSNDFTACGTRIVFNADTLFEIFPPEPGSKRWRLSATFRDRNNNGLSLSCEAFQNHAGLARPGTTLVLRLFERFCEDQFRSNHMTALNSRIAAHFLNLDDPSPEHHVNIWICQLITEELINAVSLQRLAQIDQRYDGSEATPKGSHSHIRHLM